MYAIELTPGGPNNVPAGQWHTVRALESGSVLLEMKEGKFEAVGGGGCFEVMTVKGVLNAIWQFCRYLFWPQWGSKRRRAQEEYERMLEEGSND